MKLSELLEESADEEDISTLDNSMELDSMYSPDEIRAINKEAWIVYQFDRESRKYLPVIKDNQ